ncbi:MAG: PaaI family thioesterase [Leptospiraceae bacterium]|nr:PaaI family thioesterase [Leptospiraceae bacterium]MCP5499183.1 PaaI family thioesterase [Leptospiraceae bacterium]
MEKKDIVKPSRIAPDLHPDDCYVCGRENFASLKASILFDEENGEVKFTHNFLGHEKGAPGKRRLVHGGAIAALLDEAQGVLAHHIGHIVMTDQLYLRYHKATPLEEVVEVHAWITTVRKRRLYTRATLKSAQGEVLVSSSGRWYLLPDRMIDRINKDSDELVKGFQKELIEVNRSRAKEIRKRKKNHP